MAFSSILFDQVPIVGILRGLPREDIFNCIAAYHSAGLTTVEITMNTEGAAQFIQDAVAQYEGKLNIGAGTVCTMDDLEKALNAGAQFIVTPVLNEEIIRTCANQQIPVFPGAYTPSEIYKAWTLGATMVKVFPANLLGPDYIKAVLAPLNEIKLMPTGGVNIDNMPAYLKVGVKAFGMGSLLFDKHLIEHKKWEELEQKMKAMVDWWREYHD